MDAQRLEKIILGQDNSVLAWLIRVALWPWSMIYRVGLAVYLWIYSSGIRKKRKLKDPVISVGNLTFGGTGKTPAVITIARMLVEMGMKPAVLSRGHGGEHSSALLVSDGENILCDSLQCGDEPMLLARTLRNVIVATGKDRRLSADLALRSANPDIILLDDGMQYWQLHRDIEIAMIDATRPFGSGFVMPMGDLREPISGLERADVVLAVFAAVPNMSDVNSIKRLLASRAPRAAVFASHRKPVGFTRIEDGSDLELDSLRGVSAFVFCGIGKPEGFFTSITDLGVDVRGKMVFSDHHPYTSEDIADIARQAKQLNVQAIITTQKDLARLNYETTLDNLYTLNIVLDIEDKTGFEEHIADRLNAAH